MHLLRLPSGQMLNLDALLWVTPDPRNGTAQILLSSNCSLTLNPTDTAALLANLTDLLPELDRLRQRTSDLERLASDLERLAGLTTFSNF